MKITNQTQRLIKVGTVVILPNNTVEVDAKLEQYPALADLAEKGDILVETEKNTKKVANKATEKVEETEKDEEEVK